MEPQLLWSEACGPPGRWSPPQPATRVALTYQP